MLPRDFTTQGVFTFSLGRELILICVIATINGDAHSVHAFYSCIPCLIFWLPPFKLTCFTFDSRGKPSQGAVSHRSSAIWKFPILSQFPRRADPRDAPDPTSMAISLLLFDSFSQWTDLYPRIGVHLPHSFVRYEWTSGSWPITGRAKCQALRHESCPPQYHRNSMFTFLFISVSAITYLRFDSVRNRTPWASVLFLVNHRIVSCT